MEEKEGMIAITLMMLTPKKKKKEKKRRGDEGGGTRRPWRFGCSHFSELSG